jgi:hypothetical protein
VSAGSYGNGDSVASFTVNGQGQLTAAANVVITANAANLSGTTLKSTVVTSSLTSVGTLGSLAVTGNISAGNVSATTFTGALSGAATTAGTVTTAAQPNITSVGTLSGLTVSSTISGSVSGTAATVTTAAQPNITSVGTLTALTLSGTLTGAVQIGTGTATHFGTTLTTGANSTAGTITGNWSLSAGSRLNATYADLAEKYTADADYEAGTVLIFGGAHEVTLSTDYDSHRVAGVVSTNPAYTMNNDCAGAHIATIALQGRVPVKVHGPIAKGDLMVSGADGRAVANNMARAGTILGKALENFNGDFGVIEVAVGRF